MTPTRAILTRLSSFLLATTLLAGLDIAPGDARRIDAASALALVPAPASAAPAADSAATSATAATAAADVPRPIDPVDVLDWKTIGATALSPDGKWFAWRFTPVQGDSAVTVRATDSDKTYRFGIGELPSGGPAGPPGAGGGGSAIAFSEDGKWVAFSAYPTRKEAERLRKAKKPIQTSAHLVNLATGADVEYPKVRQFAFSGESALAIVLHRYGPDAAGGGPGGGAGGAGSAGGGGASGKPKGTDLIVRDLASGNELTIGSVAEFAFDESGRRLAWTIDAEDKIGNGVSVRDLKSGAVAALDSGKASYEKPTWSEDGEAFAVLKGVDDKAYEDKLYSVIGVTALADASPRKTLYDPSKDDAFPDGLSISANRAPEWTADRAGLLFGIIEPKRKSKESESEKEKESAKPSEKDAGKDVRKDGPKDGPKDGDKEKPAPSDAPKSDDLDPEEKADLMLWHWKDGRLQSQQQVQEDRDKRFSYLATYRVADKKFIRLADEDLRDVTAQKDGRWAVGTDRRVYELTGALEGRNYQDLYVVDLTTGARTHVGKQLRWVHGASPDGSKLLYYDDGQYFVFDAAAGKATNVTLRAPVSFVDVEDDHNVVKPPAPVVGWSADSKSVLLSDLWDVWQVPVDGGAAVNLTGNGRRDRIRYRRLSVDPDEKGIDLTVPQYYVMLGEWTKKGGFARVAPGKPGAESLVWEDAAFGQLAKAKRANTVVYTRETGKDFPDYHVADADLKGAKRLTEGQAQVAAYAWSSGGRLVEYTSDAPGAKGKSQKLQGSLFLPANYEPGRKYPTIVYIYEHLSDGFHRFEQPGIAHRVNKSIYTSNGYAVLMPDINYTVNDPGTSAVWCVLPALKAAIATGVVDPARVGIQGHSWGGYQTSFLVTQTNVFKAAIAGAPLTNMISMYSLVYKNTGGGNMAIFESSQGRFRGGYWDNWDAYVRNSPIAYAKNVTTPLVILHNDKDGAVDFTQGVEYYNTLRRLKKPVVMLEYVGENHGLTKHANRYDYMVRMREFFDHHLKGAPAPDWWTDGVPRLKMDEHLKGRQPKPKPAPAPTPTPTAGAAGVAAGGARP